MNKLILLITTVMPTTNFSIAQNSDRTFMLSNVEIKKVSYPNRYGITISAEIYLPKNIDTTKKYSAVIVGTPYGGVKEQGAGI